MSSSTIVVGYDATDGARAALDEALHVAQEIGGSVVAVFAYDKVVVGGEVHDLDEAVRAHAGTALAEAVARGDERGVTVATEYAEGRPAETLVAVADAHDARFIVVGSYGERPLKGALVGSTPYKLINLAERPVIVVRVPK